MHLFEGRIHCRLQNPRCVSLPLFVTLSFLFIFYSSLSFISIPVHILPLIEITNYFHFYFVSSSGPTCSKSAATQMSELVTYLDANCKSQWSGRVWLDIEGSQYWLGSTSSNQAWYKVRKFYSISNFIMKFNQICIPYCFHSEYSCCSVFL